MDWIKRNLYFLVGSFVALVLMGLAGWYLYSKGQENAETLGKLEEQYDKLKRLNEQRPHPGSDKVDNIKAAKEQQAELQACLQKARAHFQPCPRIPATESTNVTSQEFSSALSRTIDGLQRAATKANVTLPGRESGSSAAYSFSFAAQRHRLAYAAGSPDLLAVQLGEVKAICEVLFQANINSLESLRRERISEDDYKGPQTDYLPEHSETNELAVLTPYEVVFHCFSSELAGVLAGFASSPYSLQVKTINVEPAPAVVAPVTPAAPVIYTMPAVVPTPAASPTPAAPPPSMAAEAPPSMSFEERYGRAGRSLGPAPAPAPMQPRYVPPMPVAAAPVSRGPTPALDERQLKVTLMLEVVKLLAPK